MAELPESIQSDQMTIRALKENDVKMRGQLRHIRTWLTTVQNRVQLLDPSAVKNSKRLYVGGLPLDMQEDGLKLYLETTMMQVGIPVSPGSPINGVKITKDKGFGFIEFRCVEEASNALALNGLMYQGTRLKIKRPSNYDTGVGELLGPTLPDPTIDLSSLDVEKPKSETNAEKIFVGGIPSDWGENEIKELLLPFGPLRQFSLIKDKETGQSKGYAFCEYDDGNVTEQVIKQLNQSSAGSRILTVKRALEGETVGGGGKRGGGGRPSQLSAPTQGHNPYDSSLISLMGGAAAGAVAGYGVNMQGGVPQGWQQGQQQIPAGAYPSYPQPTAQQYQQYQDASHAAGATGGWA